jgi:MOSC domain-containing protein YiiM
LKLLGRGWIEPPYVGCRDIETLAILVWRAIMSGMSSLSAPSPRVVSLHLHPAESGSRLQAVNEIELVAGKGIVGEPRYFGKISRRTGKPSRRQVSLIEREQIAKHAATLGLQSIPPGIVRSNIETEGIDLIQHIGTEIKIGEAVLFLYEGRTPCAQMDAICMGLKGLMENNRQGVMAEVVRSGVVRCQDLIVIQP